MLDIISKDSLRQHVELSSDGRSTVIYDRHGNPNIMAIIPKMTIGEVMEYSEESAYTLSSSTLSDTHPAFKVLTSYDRVSGNMSYNEVGEIFIAQYPESIHKSKKEGSDIEYKMSSLAGMSTNNGQLCNFTSEGPAPLIWNGDVIPTIRNVVHDKGSNWHIMNGWEYGLIQTWRNKNNIRYDADTNAVIDRLICRVIFDSSMGVDGVITSFISKYGIAGGRDALMLDNSANDEVIYGGEIVCRVDKIAVSGILGMEFNDVIPYDDNKNIAYVDVYIKIDNGNTYTADNISRLDKILTPPDSDITIPLYDVFIEYKPRVNKLYHQDTFSGMIYGLESGCGEFVDGALIYPHRYNRTGNKQGAVLSVATTPMNYYNMNTDIDMIERMRARFGLLTGGSDDKHVFKLLYQETTFDHVPVFHRGTPHYNHGATDPHDTRLRNVSGTDFNYYVGKVASLQGIGTDLQPDVLLRTHLTGIYPINYANDPNFSDIYKQQFIHSDDIYLEDFKFESSDILNIEGTEYNAGDYEEGDTPDSPHKIGSGYVGKPIYMIKGGFQYHPDITPSMNTNVFVSEYMLNRHIMLGNSLNFRTTYIPH